MPASTGATPLPAIADAVIKDWQDIMAINLNGVFNVTHAFLGALRASKGRIVNIASIQSFVHVRTPNSPAYTTSKHGVLGFTRALAAELGKDGVRVNAIGPGFIETPLNAKVRATNPELVKIFLDHTPLGRTGQAGRHRRAGDLPRLGPVGLCHRRDRHGRRRLSGDLSACRSNVGWIWIAPLHQSLPDLIRQSMLHFRLYLVAAKLSTAAGLHGCAGQARA